jgi:LPXTG-motif cell wall-anchored protein
VLEEGQTAAEVPWIPVGDGLTSIMGVLGIIVLGGLLFINSKRKAE